MTGCFVTGTDTGVGKTLASAGLLHALARHHARVVGMKAVAAGAEPIGPGGALANEDVLALRAASTIQVAPALDNPVLLPDPLSPHIAARRAGTRIDIAAIVQAPSERSPRRPMPSWWKGPAASTCRSRTRKTVPTWPRRSACPWCSSWACAWGASATRRSRPMPSARADCRSPAGSPAASTPSMLAAEDNIAWLRQRLRAPLLADIPHQRQPDPRATPFALPDSWTTPSA
ncbi:AAA family ATPase [Acidovorax citrulli]|nr:AAA family ATPase [Paracidovorax citrulli]